MAGTSIPVDSNLGQNSSSTQVNYSSALGLLTSLFFMWGFITCLNDILIPHLKALFNLSYTITMLIQFTFFGAYFIMSIPSGIIVNKLGYKNGIVTGLVITGIGALLFYPASIFVNYIFFLVGFFVLASGITLLQVAANPYVAVLGRPETASGRLNMTQALNSLGTTIAPIFGAMLILTENATSQAEQAEAVQLPYIGIALTLFAIAAVFLFVKLPKIETEASLHFSKDVFKHSHLMHGVLAIFLYVGAEVAIGSFLINFLAEDSIAGLAEAHAAKFVALYWGGAMIGRFFGAISLSQMKSNMRQLALFLVLIFAYFLGWYILKDPKQAWIFMIFVGVNLGAFLFGKNKPARTLSIFAILTVGLVSITIISSGSIAMWSIISVGLFNSIMFPTIFTLSIDGLGKETSQASGLLCMAIVGGAVIPLLMGVLADSFGIHHSFALTLICYLYIAYFGIKAYKHS